MPDNGLIVALLLAGIALLAVCLWLWRARGRAALELNALRDAIVEAAEHAAFGQRVPEHGGPALRDLAGTVNQLFDALSGRETDLRRQETAIEDFVNALPDVVLLHRDRVLFANAAAADLLGLTPEQLVGRPVTDLIRPAYRAMTRKMIASHLEGEPIEGDLEIQLINGGDRGGWVQASSGTLNYRGQRAVMTVARDIGYRKSVEATLGRSKQQAQYTLESIGEGVITTDTDGRIDYMNAAAEQLTGASREVAVGKRLGELVRLVDEVDRRDLGDPVGRSLTDRRRVSIGRRALMIQADGERELSVELTASPIKGPEDTAAAGVVVIMHDVTEIRGLTQKMSYQAAHDPLTGLINRREFERRIEQSFSTVRDDGVSHILCYLDLDRFKAVNDTCGHLAGDNLLREIAGLIKEQVRESDSVARLGGDEFGLLLVRCPLDKARQIADDVCRVVRDHRFVWQDKIFTVGVSIGLVEVGRDSSSVGDLLAAADSACYIAKQQGRGQVHMYSAKDEATARQRGEIHWLQQLQNALKENHFQIFTQPIIAVAGHVASGPAVEVLLRLRDADSSLVPPSRFMKAAERYQLMGAIDRWVVQAALAAIGQGTIRLPDRRSCAINLSAQTLGDESFLEFVVEALDHSKVNPEQICFEMSETAVTADLDRARRFIAVLHGLGCQFGIDDFGSGVGSLAGLRGLAIDFLKIDGAYTHELTSDTVNHQVVAAVTQLARTVGFKVIAEQVEEQADFDALRDLQVDFIQGYFIDRPAPLGQAA